MLCAGALHPPALLQAGIGPAAHVRDCGIAAVAERSGVGANLRSPPALTIAQYLPRALRRPNA